MRKSLAFAVALCCAVTSAVGATPASFPIQPGDRIAFVGNTFADQLRMHGYLETLLLQRSEGKPVSIRHLGWAGDMLTARDRPSGFPTEESELIAHKTDVLIACFGMGESFKGEAGLSGFRRDLERFIDSHQGKQYNGKSDVRLILISPIAYEDLGSQTPSLEKRNRELVDYTRVMSQVATKAGLPTVNLNQTTADLMQYDSAPKLTSNGVNLNDYGYWCVSRTIADVLMPGPQPWQLSIDVLSLKASGRGVNISEIRRDGEGVTFRVQEQSWPSAKAPVEGPVHRELSNHLDQLIVTGLVAGSYRLIVDGEELLAASHHELGTGVAIGSSPTHQALDKYREAIYDKNLQFLYSWKALNQVHIVGERRKSASGRSLPGEVVEFKTLADQQDAALANGIELKTREWRLIPAEL
jgi:hypothetical protein